jgi:hypothetical protein
LGVDLILVFGFGEAEATVEVVDEEEAFEVVEVVKVDEEEEGVEVDGIEVDEVEEEEENVVDLAVIGVILEGWERSPALNNSNSSSSDSVSKSSISLSYFVHKENKGGEERV